MKKEPKEPKTNKTYTYINKDLKFSFRIFSENKESYNIITEDFTLHKISKTEMINNIKEGKVKW